MTILFFLKPSTDAWLPAPHEIDQTILLGKRKKKRTKAQIDELRLKRHVEREHEEAFLLLLLMELEP